MKIYIVTFHWATNYGAVLQAYALQHYLKKQGCNVYIIDYVPKKLKKTFWRCLASNPRYYIKTFSGLTKEYAINLFRKKNLALTKTYHDHKALVDENWGKSIFICGSDQIWNPFFTLHGEGQVTLSYYLDFVPTAARKVSYAASFGAERLTPPMDAIIAQELVSFSKVSVRERSAVNMLKKIGISAELVCDPVFLLSWDEWEKMQTPLKREKKYVFKYYFVRGKSARDGRHKAGRAAFGLSCGA